MRRGLARSRSQATEAIRQGKVRVGDRLVLKPSTPVDPADTVHVTDVAAVVSRGAHKLSGAFDAFAVSVQGAVALDAGACTGGFTEVLLQRGARRVYAVDVGHGQLAASLKTDPRVVDMPGVNLRSVPRDWLAERCSLVVADVSFISLTLVLPALAAAAAEGADFVVLVKPQFEAGRAALDGTGVVRRATDRADAVAKVAVAAQQHGLVTRGVAPSTIVGGHGNREYFLHLRDGRDNDTAVAVSQVHDTVLNDGRAEGTSAGGKDRR